MHMCMWIKKIQHVKMIIILWILIIFRYKYIYKCKKSSICQNNQNFMNIKYIKVHAHAYKCKKSSTCQNDQNFMNINYIKVYVYI